MPNHAHNYVCIYVDGQGDMARVQFMLEFTEKNVNTHICLHL